MKLEKKQYIQYSINEAEWKNLKDKENGLWQIFSMMIEYGYAPEWRLKREGGLIRAALALIPSVDGSVDSEFSDLFAKALSDLRSEAIKYSIARDRLDDEYQAKIRDIPEREERVKKRELQVIKDSDFLRANGVDLETKRIKLFNYEAQLELKKKELELYEKKLNEIESPELRDRVRLKNEFLATVERFKDQWTNKAIVWSIGAILSGTQVPSFKGDKNNG